jgi:hypothetical protein
LGHLPVVEVALYKISADELFSRVRLKGATRAPTLERFDEEQQAPVIRVLYGTTPLPIFDGAEQAVIAPEADREELWAALIARIRAGDYDREIEAVAAAIYRTTRRAAKASRG